MRTTVICEPVRTPIGRYGGMFASLTAVELGVTALKGLLDRTGIAPEVDRGRHPRALLPQQRGARDRPGRRAGRRSAGDGSGYATRPPLRVGPAGRHPGLHAGRQRTERSRRRRRRGEHEQRGVLLHRHALGRRPHGREDPRRTGPRPDHRGWAGLPGARRHAGDRREPAPRVPHPARRAGRVGRRLAPAGRGRAEGRHVRRGDHPGHGAQPQGRCGCDRHRRAPPRRHHRRIPGQAQTRSGQAGSGCHGDGGQRQRAE